MSVLAASLLAAGAILVLLAFAGWFAARALVPRGRVFRAERLGWGLAIGLGILSASVPLSLAIGIGPGWIATLAAAAAVALLGWRFHIRERAPDPGRAPVSWAGRLWLVPLLAGVALYALRALSEPMWSNDFLAIWGLKGKLIFLEERVPARLFEDAELVFSHPEYPLGLPFLYVGFASLLGRWDDQAMAVVFPAIQVATLCVLAGWLRRRGVAPAVALGAAALVSLFEPLYAAFHTGLAEVPLAFFGLLLATSVSDAIDGTDRGATRRVAVAAALCAGTKNEGLLLVVAAMLIAVAASRRRRERPAPLVAALLLPAAFVLLAQRLSWGSPPLKDFDLGLLRPALWGALLARLGEALGTAAREVLLPAWPVLLALAAIFLAGRRATFADRALLIAAIAAAVYLLLPALAVLPGRPELGPIFLVRTALGRTLAALAPLVAAGLGGRLWWWGGGATSGGASSESG